MDLAPGMNQDDLNLFFQEADEQLQLLDEDIVRLEKELNNPDLMQEIFRAAHTLKGSSAMVGHQRLSDLAHAMENVLDHIRKSMLAITPSVIDALLHGLDIMRVLRKEMVTPDAEPTDITDVVTELSATISIKEQSPDQHINQPRTLILDDVAKAKLEKECKEGKQAYFIKVSFDKQSTWAAVRSFQVISNLSSIADIVMSQPSSKEIEEGKASHVFETVIISDIGEEDIKNLLSDISEVENIEIGIYQQETSAASSSVPDSGATLTGKEESKLSQTVRVDISRLDTLMEQVGELVINRNQISQIGRILAEKYHDDDIIITFNDSISQIAKIVSTLQQDVMSIRLLPIEIVFNTLPRLVRDLSRKENKKIDFIIDGEETEVDRSVIEHLHDPLVHMLRNAVDHGIEAPEARSASGKPETGTINLSACHEQDNIVIRLKDDGKGINPKALKKSAIEKNIDTPEAISRLTDSEAANLIFHSGFSTASEVTEVSGRGVGLDVVKTNIEVLGGSVSVESEFGQGTTFTLIMPLTLAIIPALLVSTGETICAVPLSSIVETTTLNTKEIKTVRGREVTLFRGDVLPLLHLDEVFGWKTKGERDTEETYVVIVKFSGMQVGITADALLEQQELVVKSLDQFVGGSNGISGASILGDGKVVLILDVASLIRTSITERQGNNNKKAILSTTQSKSN